MSNFENNGDWILEEQIDKAGGSSPKLISKLPDYFYLIGAILIKV